MFFSTWLRFFVFFFQATCSSGVTSPSTLPARLYPVAGFVAAAQQLYIAKSHKATTSQVQYMGICPPVFITIKRANMAATT